VARAAVQTHRTQVGVVKGKYAYIAPEQLDRGRLVDQRADLFSWGVVVHELFTGQPLFHGKSDLDTCDRIKNAPIPDPSAVRPELPPDLGAVVRTALARDPDARWPDATALCEALERAARAAGVWAWPSRLEAEARLLIGVPRRPVLGDDGLTWREGPGPSPDGDAGVGEVTPVIETRGEDGPWEEPAPRIPGDPQLTYFLRAGAVAEPWQGGDSSDVGKP